MNKHVCGTSLASWLLPQSRKYFYQILFQSSISFSLAVDSATYQCVLDFSQQNPSIP